MRTIAQGPRVGRTLIAALLAAAASACSSEPPATVRAAEAPAGPVAPKALEEATARIFENTETHADTPPHGGLVLELGNHTAHAEILLVPDTGEMTVHILDADGQPGKRIAQPSVLVDVETSGRTVRLDLEADPLEGEKAGDASRFTGRSEDLLRVGDAQITLRWILVDGQVFSDTVAQWGGQ